MASIKSPILSPVGFVITGDVFAVHAYVLADCMTGVAIVYDGVTAKIPSALNVIANVPATGESVPSAMSIHAISGEVAATPVSRYTTNLFVVHVILFSVTSSASTSTRLFAVSIRTSMLASVSVGAPDATDAEMSE
jgi:hypothetical protein